jgi:ankyrin repeat protein
MGSKILDILYDNNLEEMNAYLHSEGDPNFLINGKTPLCIAKSAEMAELLLERGADIHFRDSRGRTPLLHQVLSARPEIVRVIVRADPSIIHDVDKNGENALHLCAIHAFQSSLECAEILLTARPPIDLNAKRNDGLTALDIAIKLNNTVFKDFLRRAATSKTIARFVNNEVNKARTLHHAWRPPNGNGNLGGNAYKALAEKHKTKTRKSRKSRKSRKARKSRKM